MNNVLKIVAIATFIVIIFYFSLKPADLIFGFISPDTFTYIDASNMLYEELKPHPTRPLGYTFISGLPKLIDPNLSEQNYILFAVFINFLAWLGSLIFYYKSLILYFPKKASLFLIFPFLFMFGSIAHIFLMLTESLTMFCLSAITFSALKYRKTKEIRFLTLATVLLNLVIMIRPGFIYLGIITSLAMGISLFNHQRRKATNSFISLFLISLLFITIQNISMFREYGKVTTSFIDKTTWYSYLGAVSYAEATNVPAINVKRSRRRYMSNKSYKEISQTSTNDLKHQLIENPYFIFKNWLLNMARNSIAGSSTLRSLSENGGSAFSTSLYYTTRFQNIFFTSMFMLSLLLIATNLFKQDIAIYFLTIIVAYVILTSGISFYQGDRFHFILYQMISIIFLLLVKDTKCVDKWIKRAD